MRMMVIKMLVNEEALVVSSIEIPKAPIVKVASPTSPTRLITWIEGVVHILEASVEVACPTQLKEKLFTSNT